MTKQSFTVYLSKQISGCYEELQILGITSVMCPVNKVRKRKVEVKSRRYPFGKFWLLASLDRKIITPDHSPRINNLAVEKNLQHGKIQQ